MKSLVSLIVFLVSASAFAHGIEVGSQWESEYIKGKGQFHLDVVSQQEVAITHDRNTCSFGRLGEVGGCSRMGFHPKQGKLVYVPVAADRRTAVYSLEGTNYQIVHRLAQRGPDGRLSLRLLIMTEDGQYVQDSILLSLIERN